MTSPDLLPSLRFLVRGLLVLFWGLPATLLACVLIATAELPRALGFLPALVSTGLLLYGLFELTRFRPQEREWRAALERAQLLGFTLFGLSPFVYFWSRMPSEDYYLQSLVALAFMGLVFVYQLNHVLQRLAAMLPDETLRADTQFFTQVNLTIMILAGVLAGTYHALDRMDALPPVLLETLDLLEGFRPRLTLVVLLVLLPISMTMSLLWKMKDTVLGMVYGARS